MMERVIDETLGVVHFKGQNGAALCGLPVGSRDLFGNACTSLPTTDEPVTCPDCALLYCRVKNEPWHAVAEHVLERAIYDAVRVGGETQKEND